MNLRDLFLATDVASDWNFCHFVDICNLFAVDHFDLILIQSKSAFRCKSATKYLTFITNSHSV